MSDETPHDERLLAGIRVLDFSRVLAGPYASMHLADLGADVLKVEHPVRGDDTRAYGPPFVDGVSTYFLSVNRGKRSVALDLKDPADRNRARALAAKADVVLENFRPGVMDRLGLGPAALRAEHPGLVYCTIRAFSDPEDPRPGYDLMMQALSGVPSITGAPGTPPAKCGASIADLASGMNAIQGVLAALLRRERTGQGAHVVVSIMEAQRSLLTYHAGAWLNAGSAAPRLGNAHRSIHPFCVYAAREGHLALCIGNDALWGRFCAVLGEPGWATDPRFATNLARVEHRAAVDALLAPRFAQESAGTWADRLLAAGVPAAAMATVPEALAGAETVAHPHPVTGAPVRSLPLPLLVDGARPVADRGPAALGADTEAALADWLGAPAPR